MNEQPNQNGEPVLNHRQAKSQQVAQRIYAEFRWNLKKAAGQLTWPDVAEMLDTCIRLSTDMIPDETIRRQCIAQFKAMREKVLALATGEARANLAKLTGDACVRCGVEFEPGAPKTWVADGEYVCAKCQ